MFHQRHAQDQIAAIRAGADQAAGGASRVTSITMGGIRKRSRENLETRTVKITSTKTDNLSHNRIALIVVGRPLVR